MPIDPLLRLAVAVHASPGVYALLLGSGVSRGAGIPTGWEVTLDLVRQIATAGGDDAAAECAPDPAAWYQRQYGVEPDYSTVLNAVAGKPAERQRLLRGYFDPASEADGSGDSHDRVTRAGTASASEEPDRGRPTAAHHAAAALAASGHVRVILTTNFDTLMETALAAAGVAHAVLSSADDIAGAPPLVHGGVVVVKLHGDYRDARIRNTPEELAGYDPEVRQFLERILDEFGLVVCGWSADYDTALREAITCTPARRYTMFWAARGEPSATARNLIQQRGAEVIAISDADAFLAGLADRVHALQTLDAPHPLDAPVAVARLKRYVAAEVGRIRAHDLTLGAADDLWTAARADHGRLGGTPTTLQNVRDHLARLEARSATFVGLMATGCYWGTEEHERIWTTALGRASDLDALVLPTTRSGEESTWNNLRYYPATLAFYAAGMAAAAAGRWRVFNALLTHRVTRYIDRLPAPWWLHAREALGGEPTGQALGDVNLLTPTSERVYRVLASPLRDVYADSRVYEEAFDEFEYLLALFCADDISQGLSAGRTLSVPVGRFARLHRHPTSGRIAPAEGAASALRPRTGDAAGAARWPPLVAGMFGGSIERLAAAIRTVETLAR